MRSRHAPDVGRQPHGDAAMKEYDFAGTVVAVTGAGHGFGRAIAQSFAALGAQVFATDLSAEELEETADHPGAIHTSAFDLTAPGAAKAWIAEIETPRGGPGRRAGLQCRRRARPGDAPARGRARERLARHRRHQPACAFPARAGGRTGHEARRPRADRDHQLRRRAAAQPHRHPGLYQREARADRADAAARA